MKTSHFIAGISLFCLLAGSVAGKEGECGRIAKEVAKRVSEEPEKVLMVVDEEITKNEDCSCEIVKSAIRAAEADKELTAQIVTAAVYAATEKAAVIAECAIAERPEAAGTIKLALKEVFEGAKTGLGKAPVSGKEVADAKEVIVDDGPDYAPRPTVVSGVYMIPPVAGSGTPSGQLTPSQIRSLSKELGIPVSVLQKILEDGRPNLVDVIRRQTTVSVKKKVKTTPAPQSP